MSPQEKVDALEYVIKKAVATGMSGILRRELSAAAVARRGPG